MGRYVAWLGGINVGGHRVTMDRLRALFLDLGHREVWAFLASGNVVFGADEDDPVALAEDLERALRDGLGYAVPTFVRRDDQVIDLAARIALPATGTQLVAFLRRAPDPDVITAVEALGTEVDTMRIVGAELWWHVAGKIMDSRVPPNAWARAGLGRLTTRNVTTVHRLARKLVG